MTEADADVFGFGECSARWIPTYSSFTLIGISLTKMREAKVYFRKLKNGEIGFIPL